MKKLWSLPVAAFAGVLAAAAPGNAAVDVLDRLTEKGIITEAERDELKKAEAKPTVGYKDNFYLLSADKKSRLDIYGYGQVRYTYWDKDETDNTSSFDVQRVRLGFKGYAFTEALKYGMFLNVLQYNSDNSASRDMVLNEFFLDYAPVKEVGIKFGEFKVPYSTSYLYSPAAAQFVDNPTVDTYLRLDYDTGINLHGTLFNSVLSYDAGVYNGEGLNKTNVENNLMYVARVTAEPFGKYPNHESDNELSKSFLLFAAAAAAYDDNVGSYTIKNLKDRLSAVGESDVKHFDGFLGMKYRGASVQSEYYHRKISPRGKDTESARGLYVQAGYFVWRDLLEVAGRYELFDPNMDNEDDLHQEYGGGLNWFFAGHRNKVQADFFRINDQKGQAASVSENRMRVQYTLQF